MPPTAVYLQPNAMTNGRAPAVVITYLWFSVLITLGELGLFFARGIHAQVVPFIGWVPSMPYMFGLYWAFLLYRRPSWFARWAIVGTLAVGAAIGLFEYNARPREAFGNPWLTVSPWQPLWTVALPLLWCCLLFLPTVSRYCRVAAPIRPPKPLHGS